VQCRIDSAIREGEWLYNKLNKILSHLTNQSKSIQHNPGETAY